MPFFNPLDFDRWRGIVRDFDAKRDAFYATLRDLSAPVPDAKLEAQRQALVARAAPLKAELEKTMRALAGVRDAMQNAGKYFGLGGMQTLGALPVIIVGASIAGVAFVIGKITDWLRDAESWKTQRAQIEAGWTPEEIEAVRRSAPKAQPRLFGMDMGALKWAAIIAGVVIAGPYVVREIEKRTA